MATNTDRPVHRHPNHGGRRPEQMVGDVATVVVQACLLPHQVDWLRKNGGPRGASAIIRGLIDSAMADKAAKADEG